MKMYFLPDEEVEITWTQRSSPEVLQGHAWYKDTYCLFESEQTIDNGGGGRCVIYKLYSLHGQALANELARERLYELDNAPTRLGSLASALVPAIGGPRTLGVDFIGRFVGLPERRSNSPTRLRWAQERIAGAIPRRLRAMFSHAGFRATKQKKRVA